MKGYTHTVHDLIRQKVRSGAYLTLPVVSNSMAPMIAPRDRVVFAARKPQRLRVGDIIVFSQNGGLYVHRVIARRKIGKRYQLVTKGDGSRVKDEPINERQIIGKVIRVHKRTRALRLERLCWKMLGGMAAVCSYAESIMYPLLRPGRARLSHRSTEYRPF